MDSLDIIYAAKGQAMNRYVYDDAKEVVRINVDRAYTLAEIPVPDAPIYEQIVNDVTEKIMRSYGYMTSQELALVCEAGVAGELTGKTRPTVAAIFGWIASYMASELRREAIRSYRRNNMSSGERKDYSLVEREEMNRRAEVRGLRLLWEEFCYTGTLAPEHLDGYCAMVFDGALRRGIIAPTAQQWAQAKEDARLEYRRLQGVRSLGVLMDYTPEYKVKRYLLVMCFKVYQDAGREIVVND